MKNNIVPYFTILFATIVGCTIMFKMSGDKFKEINPIPWNKVWQFYFWDIIIVSFISSVIIFMGYLYFTKTKKKKKIESSTKVVQTLKDPILDKIIEDALSGKTTDDILKTQNDDSEIEKEMDDDNKEYQ